MKSYDDLAHEWCDRGEEIAKLQRKLRRAHGDVILALQALEKDKPHVTKQLLKVLTETMED